MGAMAAFHLSVFDLKYGKFARVARSDARIRPDGIFGG
jgi:hypothetical protein